MDIRFGSVYNSLGDIVGLIEAVSQTKHDPHDMK
jgi:transcriptional regulator NrdR family protein